MAKGWLVDEKGILWSPEKLQVSRHCVSVLTQVLPLIPEHKGVKQKESAPLRQTLQDWLKLVCAQETEDPDYVFIRGTQSHANLSLSSANDLKNWPESHVKRIAKTHNDYLSHIYFQIARSSAHNKAALPQGWGVDLIPLLKSHLYSNAEHSAIEKEIEAYKAKVPPVSGGGFGLFRGTDATLAGTKRGLEMVGQRVLDRWMRLLGFEPSDGSHQAYALCYLAAKKSTPNATNARDQKDLMASLRCHEITHTLLNMVDWKSLKSVLEKKALEYPIAAYKEGSVDAYLLSQKEAFLVHEALRMVKDWKKKIVCPPTPKVQWVDQQRTLSASNGIAVYVKEPYSHAREGFWTGSTLSANINNAKLFATLKEAQLYMRKKYGLSNACAYLECSVHPQSIVQSTGIDVSGIQSVLSTKEGSALLQSIQESQKEKEHSAKNTLIAQWMQKCAQYEALLKEAGVVIPSEYSVSEEASVPATTPRKKFL